jgi:hypothetical protein
MLTAKNGNVDNQWEAYHHVYLTWVAKRILPAAKEKAAHLGAARRKFNI